MEPCFLTVVIPVFNDSYILEKNIPILIDYLKSNAISYEIIIVDDGSKERITTEQIASKPFVHNDLCKTQIGQLLRPTRCCGRFKR